LEIEVVAATLVTLTQVPMPPTQPDVELLPGCTTSNKQWTQQEVLREMKIELGSLINYLNDTE
jgi:hypothetical protein